MSVGASTQNRSFTGTATLGNGQTFKGVTLTPGLARTPLVDGAAAGSEGCLTGLDPAKVSGKIVVCKGSFSRAARGQAVKQAGGVGMILYTAAEKDALMSDNHYVPTVHVRASSGAAIKAYAAAAGSGATASLSGGSRELGGGNTMAAFSSRGPLLPGDRSTGDLLKPDITAPGVQILAGNTPTAFVGAPGQLFQAIAGTSMSSPHIAGIGALMKDLHPDWTPAEMQSAIQTSARQDVRKQDGVTRGGPVRLRGGARRPQPGGGSGARPSGGVRRLPGVPAQPGSVHAVLRDRSGPRGGAHRPQRAVGHDPCARGRSDGDAQGAQRRRGGDLQAERQRAGGRGRHRDAQPAEARGRRDGDLPGLVRRERGCRLRPLRVRLAHLGRRQGRPPGSRAARHPSGPAGGSRVDLRHRDVGLDDADRAARLPGGVLGRAAGARGRHDRRPNGRRRPDERLRHGRAGFQPGHPGALVHGRRRDDARALPAVRRVHRRRTTISTSTCTAPAAAAH